MGVFVDDDDEGEDEEEVDQELLEEYEALQGKSGTPGGKRGSGSKDVDTTSGGRWTVGEDAALRAGVNEVGAKNWRTISLKYLKGKRSDVQCLHRWQKVLRPGLVKGPWTRDEDDIISECMLAGITKWSEIAQRIPGRIGKQCRERWYNHLDPSINKNSWTEEEDEQLRQAVNIVGTRWIEVSKLLKGRSENACKNRWNSAARRRVLAASKPTASPGAPCGLGGASSTPFSPADATPAGSSTGPVAPPSHPTAPSSGSAVRGAVSTTPAPQAGSGGGGTAPGGSGGGGGGGGGHSSTKARGTKRALHGSGGTSGGACAAGTATPRPAPAGSVSPDTRGTHGGQSDVFFTPDTGAARGAKVARVTAGPRAAPSTLRLPPESVTKQAGRAQGGGTGAERGIGDMIRCSADALRAENAAAHGGSGGVGDDFPATPVASLLTMSTLTDAQITQGLHLSAPLPIVVAEGLAAARRSPGSMHFSVRPMVGGAPATESYTWTDDCEDGMGGGCDEEIPIFGGGEGGDDAAEVDVA